jgi:hypothetical protein
VQERRGIAYDLLDPGARQDSSGLGACWVSRACRDGLRIIARPWARRDGLRTAAATMGAGREPEERHEVEEEIDE